jgi:hypothetical protein
MDDSAFLNVLRPYMEAFCERDRVRRLALLQEALDPQAEICGPSRVFTGYSEIADKIDAFHTNWPACRLVLTSGLITFQSAAHFAKAIVGADGQIRAAGHSVAVLAADGRIHRVLAFWGQHPRLPETWPSHLSAEPGASLHA